MRIRFPWPLRRTPEAPPRPGSEARRELAGGDAGGGRAIDVEPEFASGFRTRAHERDVTPLLGPWGGVGETARFAVAATRFQGTLLTQRWSDEIVASENRTGHEPAADFIASLPSLLSYGDPTGAPGASGSAFADNLPVMGGTGTFVTQGSGPPVPAVPAFAGTRSIPPRPANAPPLGRAIERAPATAARPLAAASQPAPRPDLQRGAGQPLRPRSTVSEPPSPQSAMPPEPPATSPPPMRPAPDLTRESPAPPVGEDVPTVPPVLRDSPLPLAAAGPQSGGPSPNAAPAPPAARAADASTELRSSSTASTPPPADVARAAEALPAARERPVVPVPATPASASPQPPAVLGDSDAAVEPPLGALDPDTAPASALPRGDAPLTLASDQAAEPRALEPGSAAGAEPPRTEPRPFEGAAPAPSPGLLEDEVPPPLSPVGTPAVPVLLAAPPQPGPLRRFSVGEPIAPELPRPESPPEVARVTARGGTATSSPRATSLPRATAIPVPSASLPLSPATPLPPGSAPVVRAVSVRGERPLEPRVELPLLTPGETAAAMPGPSLGSASPGLVAGPGSQAEPPLPPQRVLDVLVSRAAADRQPLLFQAPPQPPLQPETPATPGRISRTTAASAVETSPTDVRTPATATASAGLPLARLEGWPGAPSQGEETRVASWTDIAVGSAAFPRPLTPGAAAGARTVNRAADDAAAGASGEASPGAVGEIGPAEDPAKADQDLDRLTEKVWQRIRRTLQLERERRRGLP